MSHSNIFSNVPKGQTKSLSPTLIPPPTILKHFPQEAQQQGKGCRGQMLPTPPQGIRWAGRRLLGTFKKASMSPTAGMKSGMKGFSLCSRSIIWEEYLKGGRH